MTPNCSMFHKESTHKDAKSQQQEELGMTEKSGGG
jgi:hypothetical protein